jgi:hypothetical protein
MSRRECDMKTKEGFARLTVWIPKEQYNQLVERKMINGISMSESITQVLSERANGNKK